MLKRNFVKISKMLKVSIILFSYNKEAVKRINDRLGEKLLINGYEPFLLEGGYLIARKKRLVRGM